MLLVCPYAASLSERCAAKLTAVSAMVAAKCRYVVMDLRELVSGWQRRGRPSGQFGVDLLL